MASYHDPFGFPALVIYEDFDGIHIVAAYLEQVRFDMFRRVGFPAEAHVQFEGFVVSHDTTGAWPAWAPRPEPKAIER